VVDDVDAAQRARRGRVRSQAAALAAPLCDNVDRSCDEPGRELRRARAGVSMEVSMKRTKPPFRGDHVGSLLRPPALLQARADFAAGTIDAATWRGIEDDAIR